MHTSESTGVRSRDRGGRRDPAAGSVTRPQNGGGKAARARVGTYQLYRAVYAHAHTRKPTLTHTVASEGRHYTPVARPSHLTRLAGGRAADRPTAARHRRPGVVARRPSAPDRLLASLTGASCGIRTRRAGVMTTATATTTTGTATTVVRACVGPVARSDVFHGPFNSGASACGFSSFSRS